LTFLTLFPLIWLGAVIIVFAAILALRPNKHVAWLLVTIVLIAVGVWISLPENPGLHYDLNNDGTLDIDRDLDVVEGLDLAGGIQILLQADLPEGQVPDATSMTEVRRIIGDRVDALGNVNPVIQQRGTDRIIVEIPGAFDPDEATSRIQQTALLEFVELPTFIPEGTPIRTDYRENLAAGGEAGIVSGTPTITPTTAATPTGEPTETPTEAAGGTAEPTLEPTPEGPVYHTVMTGSVLQSAVPASDPNTGQIVISFILKPEGKAVFAEYTTNHVGGVLGIVLDGRIISAPSINQPITEGQGEISGSFTRAEAERLAQQLQYGALPVPLKVQSTSTVGPTLGQISIDKSIQAGIIGIIVVLAFVLIYYRLPGVAAALALLTFALLNFSLYKVFSITMTLPAITGFLISVGTAVDGNILIFERMKEELRRGRKLEAAVDAGFSRAWTSIRDSNFSTAIICSVLIMFGTSFGAGYVTGFALALMIGLALNLFTAVTVTRTFLHFILLPFEEQSLTSRRGLLGL
jgi:protein-export membrane protein SecD